MELRKCVGCEKEYPISEYTYHWKSGTKTIRKCRSCLNEYSKERMRLKREEMGSDVQVRALPNTYRNDEQRKEVFNFLYLIGWNFNEEKGIWWKKPIKNKDGVFLQFEEQPIRHIIPFEKPEGYVHKNKGKTKLSKDQFKELYDMRQQGYTFPQLMQYFNLTQPTLYKYIKYYEANRENENW